VLLNHLTVVSRNNFNAVSHEYKEFQFTKHISLHYSPCLRESDLLFPGLGKKLAVPNKETL
jgi:hypothetical protein